MPRWEQTVYPIHISMSGLKPLEIEKVIREALRDATAGGWELVTVQGLTGGPTGSTQSLFLFFKRLAGA